MARGKSAYNQFIGRRLKGTPSRELPSAMRAAAAEWRGMRGRRNPGGSSLVTLALVGGGLWWGYNYLKTHPNALGGGSTTATQRTA